MNIKEEKLTWIKRSVPKLNKLIPAKLAKLLSNKFNCLITSVPVLPKLLLTCWATPFTKFEVVWPETSVKALAKSKDKAPGKKINGVDKVNNLNVQ